jgi:hypothetical protein
MYYDFPDNGAKRITPLSKQRANGYVIEYLDVNGEPDSEFIDNREWDEALEIFENRIEGQIINHYPAKQAYDF